MAFTNCVLAVLSGLGVSVTGEVELGLAGLWFQVCTCTHAKNVAGFILTVKTDLQPS